jgi:hypothetical protein
MGKVVLAANPKSTVPRIGFYLKRLFPKDEFGAQTMSEPEKSRLLSEQHATKHFNPAAELSVVHVGNSKKDTQSRLIYCYELAVQAAEPCMPAALPSWGVSVLAAGHDISNRCGCV